MCTHHGVSARDGGRDFEGEEVEREVPGADEPGHAHRGAGRVVHCADAIQHVRAARSELKVKSLGHAECVQRVHSVRSQPRKKSLCE